MLNHITIMGRLTRDPELRYTESQKPVTTFSIACENDQPAEKKRTDFFDIVSWRHAEFISGHFFKGSMAIISGRLQIREWTDKDGNKRRSAEIVEENIYFGDSKKKDNEPVELSSTDYGDLPWN